MAKKKVTDDQGFIRPELENLSDADRAIEILKCYNDVYYFIEHYIMLDVPGLPDPIPFVLWIPQHRYIDALTDIWTKKEKNGVIFMASRQCGKTQLTEAYIVWLLLFYSKYSVLHFNRDLDQAKTVIREIKSMISMLPTWLRPSYLKDTASEGFILANKSQFIVQASNKTVTKKSAKARGKRPNFIWIDEAAFIYLNDHLTAILPTVSRTFVVARKHNIPYGIVLTSTPNGRVNEGKEFYTMFTQAEADPDNIYSAVKIYWHEIPGYDEEWYRSRCLESGCTPEKPNSKVNQEFNLLFISSDGSIFEEETMKDLQNPKFAHDPIFKESFSNGYIHWYEEINGTSAYLVGIDTATAVGDDYSTFQVINYDTDAQVCEGKFKCTVDRFCNTYVSDVLNKLPIKVIIIERNGVGNQTVEELQKKYYEYILKDKNDKCGIASSTKTRSLMLECFYQYVEDDEYRNKNLRSKNLRIEAASFERKPSGRIEGSPHDDLCFAYGWLLYVKTYMKRELMTLLKYTLNHTPEHDVEINKLLSVACADTVQISNDYTMFEQIFPSLNLNENQRIYNDLKKTQNKLKEVDDTNDILKMAERDLYNIG